MQQITPPAPTAAHYARAPLAYAAPSRHTPPLLPMDTAQAPLHFKLLRTASQRQAIAPLRRLAAFGVERDLALGLEALESVRDDHALVVAVYGGLRPVATLRFVPTGHGLTGAERLAPRLDIDPSILGTGSWEVGRVIMGPEDRNPDLLLQCLALTLRELMQLREVRHFHATTTVAMARLWRRVGMRTVASTEGSSGTRYCLVHGRVEAVAAALQIRTAEAAIC